MSIFENNLLAAAVHELCQAEKYNPFANFSGVKTAGQFTTRIAADPAFSFLGLDNPKYTTARIGGNLVTSIHRKIGDMYEVIFKRLLEHRFGLSATARSFSLKVQIGDRVQTRSTDGLLPSEHFDVLDLPMLTGSWRQSEGLAFELRSCYQIGDSKRIQADWDMALALKAIGLTPIMLVMCDTSLKSPLLRLSKSWSLFEGHASFAFIEAVTQFDLRRFMADNEDSLRAPVDRILAKV